MADETDAPEVIADIAPDAPEAATEHDNAPPVTVDALASEMGWKPLDQWQGDKTKWRPADEYVRATVNINKSLAKDQKAMRDQIERMARTSAAVVEQQVIERLAAAEARFADAVESGDVAAAKAATNAIKRIEATAPQPASAEDEFAAANPWYGKDDEATAHAVSVSQRLAQQGRSIPEQLEAAAESVRKRFPELFDAPPPRKAAPQVNGVVTRTTGAPREKGVADLPAQARQSGEMFVRKGLVKSMADYAKSYWAENPA